LLQNQVDGTETSELFHIIAEPTGACVPYWHFPRKEMEMSLREWLQMQDPDYCHDRIFSLVPEMDKSM
jgi:hypothetical protein